MANKEETFWCKVLIDTQKNLRGELYAETDVEDVIVGKVRDPEDFRKFNLADNGYSYADWQRSNIDEEDFVCITKVIWHPVMIGDVLDFFKDKRFYCKKCKKIVDWRDVSDDQLWGEYYCNICNNNSLLDIEDDIVFYWFKKREPIEVQEDQCIDYIYSLIQK